MTHPAPLPSSVTETPETDSDRVSEERLRECPFCGGEATVHNYPNVTSSGRDWFVHCKPCDMSLDAFSTRADAIAAWNRRTTPSLPPRSGGVVVKGLEWEGDRSKSVVGTYATVRTPDGYAVTFDGEEIAHIGHNSVSAFEGARNAAQSHAQADYEAHIRSTLADPIPEAPADEEVEGVPCERCQGNGEIVTDWERYRHPLDGDVGDEAVASCPDCYGTGRAMEGLHFTADWLVRGMPVKTPGSNRRGRVASEVTFDGKVYVDYPAGGGAYWPATELQPWESHRDVLGRLVRDAWVKWARSQPNPKASWLVAYDDLPEADKEADRQIGEALTTAFPPVLNAALRRSTETDKPGVREAALEEAAKVADMFAADHAKSADQFGIDRNRELHNAAKGAAQGVAFAIRALSAPLAAEQPVAEGWKLVPVEPTDEMTAGAIASYHRPPADAALATEHVAKVFRAMLAAAPLPRSTTGGAK